MPALDDLWDDPQPHTLHTKVREQDIDGLNHTNNVVYVRWCERVAWQHSVSLGLDLNTYRSLNRAMAINHSEYSYLQASYAGQAIVVGTWIVEWDRKLTMHRRFQVIRIEDGVTLLRAKMRFVCIDITSGRPKRMPPEFVNGYGPAVLTEGTSE